MKIQYKHEEVLQYWVGLLDADGSIQCNHWRKKELQYRIVIKMRREYTAMLETIRLHVGGIVRFCGKNDVILVEDHQRKIWKLLQIFDRYPPLTTRVQCQIAFLKECRSRNDVEWMLQNRQNRYYNRDAIRNMIVARDIQSLDYFPIWCSGFIEGEGCFLITSDRRVLEKNTIQSFSIAQKNDKFLIESIKKYFGGTNRIRCLKNEIFVWKVYKRDVLKNIIAHHSKYGLLGKKNLQLKSFVNVFIKKDLMLNKSL
uniref:Intron-encoded endonuclease aI3 n=1 Tax=Jaagichlorella hainangensis TaxID=445995 RepID=A0A6M8U2X7_9CHLO|nr:intron-encoded endonuclease aI3 [Jaagichlorella hainangensis]QKJ84925.1 intron-encoded endonuclease aI3 [Jaagichlorella hainangensis]